MILVVLGMHRSGTSPLTRVLSLLGADLGSRSRLISAAPDNPTGFWENRPLLERNEELLGALGGTAWSPPPLPEGWWRDPRIEPLREAARRTAAEQFPGRGPSVWKDPRTCLTFPFWEDLLGPAVAVIAVRNPLETVASLEARDGIPGDVGMCLWESYARSALRSTRDVPRLAVRYESLLADPAAEAERIRDGLTQLGVPGLSSPDGAALREFLRPDLRHAHRSLADLKRDPRVTADQVELYRTMKALARGESVESVPAAAAVVERVTTLYRSHVELQDLGRERMSEAEAHELERRSLRKQLAAQTETLREAEVERARALADLRNITGSKAWAVARRMQSARRGITVWTRRGPLRRTVARPAAALWRLVREKHEKLRVRRSLEKVLGGRASRREALEWFRGRRAIAGNAKAAVLNRPLVNVVVTCHDDAEYLPDLLRSLREQTFQRFRLTLVDDASTTAGSLEILSDLEPEVSADTTLLRLPENVGLAAARNRGIESADGAVPYIACVDADDVLHPDFLQRTVALLESRADLGVAYFDYQYFGEEDDVVRAPEYDLPALLQENFMVACSVYRRALWDQLGGYDEGMRGGYEDWEFWIRMAEAGWFGERIPEILLYYRRRAGSLVRQAWAASRDLVEHIRSKHRETYAPERMARIRAAWSAAASAPRSRARPPLSQRPLVSVVVPCFNQGDTLEQTVESVMAQTYPSVEVVVVNDGSTDSATIQVCRSLTDRGVRVVDQENAGLSAARNAGIRAANGELILPLDSDDVLLPQFVESCVSELRNDDRAGFVYSDIVFFGEESGVHAQEEFNASLELTSNHVTVSAMFRKADWEDAGGYNPNMGQGMEDWNFWVSLLERGCFGKLIHAPLFGYRVRGGSMSRKMLPHVPELVSRVRANHEGLYRPAVVRKLRERESPRATAWARYPVRREMGGAERRETASPRLSVVVPVHGHERYFPSCVRSVLEQRGAEFELVLVDDASRSGEIDRLLEEASMDPRCRVVRNRSHAGISRTLNRGIAAAGGTHIAFLDCDDELVPGALARVQELLEGRDRTWYASTRIVDVDHQGAVIEERIRSESEADLMRGNFAGHLKVIARETFERIGPFDPSVDGCQDYDLALRCSEELPLVLLDEALYRYRWHAETISVARESEQEALAESVRRRARLRRFLRDDTVRKGALFGIEVILLGPDAPEPELPASLDVRVTRLDGEWEAARDDLAALDGGHRRRLAEIASRPGPPMVLLVGAGTLLGAGEVLRLVIRRAERPGRCIVVPGGPGIRPSLLTPPQTVHARTSLVDRDVLALLADSEGLPRALESGSVDARWAWGVDLPGDGEAQGREQLSGAGAAPPRP